MKHALIAILFTANVTVLFSQVPLLIEGKEIIDTETGISNGYSIPRSQPTALTFRNNALTSVNAAGYMLQAGDEALGLNNNNLDGAIITGNRFAWNGTDETSLTHALFTGYNLDVIIKYNYLNKTPNGIQRKSNGMTDVSGVIAYNIINNPKVGIVVKGMNGVRIYNNTLYCEMTTSETGRGLIDIHTNADGGLNAASKGTKIYNNIFYTKYETICINVMDSESLANFESDYNVFYCETGSVKFNAGGSIKTFTEWQALGYDNHSVVVNPNFNNFSDFIPEIRLDYGKNLGSEFQEGLAIDAIWGANNPRTTYQIGLWQVGARIYEASVTGISIYPNPAYGYFYVLNTDPDLIYQTMKIYDATGRIVLVDPIEFGLKIIPVPEHFSSGLYNIALEADNLDRHVKKLLIIN
jgi:hypothetical protein